MHIFKCIYQTILEKAYKNRRLPSVLSFVFCHNIDELKNTQVRLSDSIAHITCLCLKSHFGLKIQYLK